MMIAVSGIYELTLRNTIDQGNQLINIEGFCEARVHAGVGPLLAVAVGRVRG